MLAVEQVRRLLTVMIRAGTRDYYIAGLLADDDGRGGLMADIPIEMDLRELVYAIPAGHAHLAGAAAAIAAHAVRRLDSRGGRETEDPLLLSSLASRLSQTTRLAEALTAAERAAKAYERLAQSDANALPGLAMSLTGMSALLRKIGRRQEALAPAERAVSILERQVQNKGDVHLPALASSLRGLSDVQDQSKALASAERAVRIVRRLVEASPGAYLPDMAESLDEVSSKLARVGRWEEAAEAAQEAVEIFSGLTVAFPGEYWPEVGRSLWNLAYTLNAVGRIPESLE
jgi:tetratricopeptide (TPR) repeat protein